MNIANSRAGLEAALRASVPFIAQEAMSGAEELPRQRSLQELAEIAHINDRNHTQFGTRNYRTHPVKSVAEYVVILTKRGVR